MLSRPNPVRVAAAVVRRDDAVLLCQRALHKRHGGLWEFPGGKILGGESMLDAVRRELREELRIDVLSVGNDIVTIRDGDSPFTIEFVGTEIEGEPVAVEHEQIAWVSIDKLGDYELTPADAIFARDHLATREERRTSS